MMTSRSSKSIALQKLNELWSAKDLPLKAVATQAVPGEGNPDTDILFIGEAPGKNEDEQGRPFVGAAGKFLDQLIQSIGYKREDVFIANIIKHRPPGNRDPLPDEIGAYAEWLEEQIRIINPPLIVTLGRFSMEFLLGPGLSITKVHGQPKRRNNQVVIPMYHPAAALYRGDLRPVLAADFQKIPKVLQLIKAGKDTTKEEKVEPAEAQKALL
jgi:uracil-DNA glycosylase family 4